MQGDIDRAGETMGRFIFNTVAGFGGVFDVAGEAGIEYHQEDFGQTLAVWGVEEGPYLMLPFIGPSSGRDAIGIIVDAGLDPLRWWGYNSDDFVIENNGLIRTVAEAVDTRSRNYKQLEDLEETSLDFYATVRSLYRQQRESLIRNGVPDDDALPNIGFEGYEGIDTESDGKDTQASLVN
jgi:phospholipid-binding lipoprotein MlaA